MARNVSRNVNVKMGQPAVVLMATARVRESGEEFFAVKVSAGS